MEIKFSGIQPVDGDPLAEHSEGGDLAARWMIHTQSYSLPPTVAFCLNFLGRDWFAARLKGPEKLTFAQLMLTLYGVQKQGLLMSKKDAMRAIGVEHVTTMKRYTDLGVQLGLVKLERSKLDGRMEFIVLTDSGNAIVDAELSAVRRSMDWSIAKSADLHDVVQALEEQGPAITVEPPKLEELAVVADAFGGASPLGPLDKEGRPPPGTSPRTFARYIAAYTETLRVDPHNIEARSGRATKYRWLAEMTENEAESRRYYEAALKDAQDLAKQDVGFLAMSADLHRRLSQWDEAISAIDRLVESDPGTTYPRMTRGWALAAKGEWMRALEDLNAVIDEHRSGPDEWLRVRGIVHANLGNLEEALADFSAAYDSAATTASIARSFVTDPDLAKYKVKAEALKDAEQAEGYADMLMKLRDVVAETIASRKSERKSEKKKARKGR